MFGFNEAEGHADAAVAVFTATVLSLLLYLLSLHSQPAHFQLPPLSFSTSFAQRSSFVSAKALLKSFIKCHKLLRSARGRGMLQAICYVCARVGRPCVCVGGVAGNTKLTVCVCVCGPTQIQPCEHTHTHTHT